MYILALFFALDAQAEVSDLRLLVGAIASTRAALAR